MAVEQFPKSAPEVEKKELAEDTNRIRRRKIGAVILTGAIAIGIGSAKLGNHLQHEKERLNSPQGTEEVLKPDECIEILPESKLRENPDASDKTWESVERVIEVEESLALCSLDAVRKKSNTTYTNQNMFGIPAEALLGTNLDIDAITALKENGDTEFIWVLDSPTTARVVAKDNLN